MDDNALLDMCTNLVDYDEAMKAGHLCAVVVARGRQLIALTTDRDKFCCDTIALVVDFLLRKGIQNDTLVMPDWRQGEIAPPGSEQMQIRACLRAVAPFREGTVSIGRAAQLAGLSRDDFMRVLGERQIPLADYDPADLAEETIHLRNES